jgi:hypothetical protein
MALKIGSLFVSLTANTDGFAKSMGQALKDVEKFSKEVKKAANDAAQVAGSITALGGAALKLASDVSGPTKAAMDELKMSMQQAAKPIAEALLPAVREASNVLRGMGKAFAELSPETKAMVGEVFKVAAAVTAASLVVGRLASTVNLLAGVFSGTFAAIAAVGAGPLLAIVAGVGLVIGGITLLHRAWRLNWGGIQEVATDVVNTLKEVFGSLASTIGKVFDFFVDAVAGFIEMNLKSIDAIQKAFGKKFIDVEFLRAGFKGLFEDLKSGAFMSEAVKFGKTVGSEIGGALLDEWKQIGKELGLDSILSKIRGISAGAALAGGPKRPLVSGALAEGRMMGLGNMINAGDAAARRAVNPEMRGPRRINQTTAVKGEDARRNFEKFQQEQVEAAKEASEAMKSSLANTATTFVGKLGQAGGIINNVINAASQGGPWAAVAAALGELLTQTKAFVDVMDIASGGLKVVTDALEPVANTLFTALGHVLAPAFQVVAVAVQAISPVLATVAQVLEMVAPIVMLLVPIISSLQPLLQFVADVLKGVFSALEPVFRVIFVVVQVIMVVVTAVQRAIVGIWNGLLDAIGAIVDTVVALFTAGLVTNGGDFVRAGKGSVSGLDASLKEFTTLNYDSAKAAAAAAAANMGAAGASDRLKDTVDAVNESFLNVPTGFKVAAARFNADSGGYFAGGMSNANSGVNIGQVIIYANDSADAVDQLQQMIVRRTFRNTGSTAESALAAIMGAR